MIGVKSIIYVVFHICTVFQVIQMVMSYIVVVMERAMRGQNGCV